MQYRNSIDEMKNSISWIDVFNGQLRVATVNTLDSFVDVPPELGINFESNLDKQN